MAKDLYDRGQTAQKWFFRYGPPDGEAGFSKIAGLVEGLRTELGEEAMLMFDFAVGQRGRCDWDVDYAIRVAKAIQPFNPTWLEEPFSPEEIESYRRLRGETDITLATGEHTYTRWNILPFLEEKLVSFVQSDPEWCGGISELLKICKMAKEYDNIRVIPHGHHILAASQVVASQPESLCPMVEYGPNWVMRHQSAQTRVVSPTAGYISTPGEPGIGPSIDWERFEQIET
jgi:L-alanine-DL-glutamate epimerase-like enolase superfamily enzyme